MDTVLPAVVDGITPYTTPILAGAGAVGALLAIVVIWRWLRRGHVHTRLGTLAVTLATAYAMEGMYEVATGPLGLTRVGALMLCATFEVAMVHQASLAAYKLRHDPRADVARHMVMVWLIAAASGVIASTASSSITEVLLRLSTPPLAAGIWYMSLYADRPSTDRQPSTWIWTPQRIGVRLGLLRPGAVDDLDDVGRQRTVRRMVAAGMVVWAGRQVDGPPTREMVRARGRLQRLAQRADRATIDAAAEQLRLAIGVEDLLLRPQGQVDEATREVLEQVRMSTRQVTEHLRAQHRAVWTAAMDGRAGGQADGTWSNSVARMPSSVAERIRPDRPAESAPSVQSSATDEPSVPVVDEPAPVRPVHVVAADRPRRRTTTVRTPVDAETLARLLDEAGEDLRTVSRDRAAEIARGGGFSLANGRAGELLRELRAALVAA